MKLKKFLSPEGKEDRIVFNTNASIIYNILLAFSKLSIGIYTISFFLCMNAFYNLGISLAKLIAIKGFKRSHLYDTHRGYGREAYRTYMLVGIILTISACIYIIYSARLFITKVEPSYSFLTAITLTGVTFVEIVLAIHGLLTTSKEHEPAVNAIKMTNLSSSLISLMLTQSAIMSISNKENIPSFYHGLAGIFIGGIAIIIGIYMIIHMSRILNGKNLKAVLKKLDKIIKINKIITTYTFIRYEDYGPNSKYLYVEMEDMIIYLRLKELVKNRLKIQLVNESEPNYKKVV